MIALNENSKRPKLENVNSASSTSTTTTKSSNATNLSREASQDPRTTHVPSLISIPAPWFPNDASMQAQLTPTSTARKLSGGPSTSLPGYRDTVIGPNVNQTLAWRDHIRPGEIPTHGYNRQGETKISQSGILNAPDAPTGFGQAFHNQPRSSISSIGAFSPPALSSDSTISTQQSTASSLAREDPRQSTYFAPRIPLDQSRERPSFPMHPLFSGSSSKAQGHFDTQLPPIRHPSLSPQLPTSMSYNSPSGKSC